MDIGNMGRRYYSYLVFLGLLVAFFLPLPSNGVEAQGATCPDNTNPFGPAPTGSYALDALCLDNEAFADFSVSFDDDYPCNSAILVEDNVGATLNDRWGEMAWSPPTGMTFPNGYATIRFWLNVTTVWGNYDGAMHVRIISYYGGSQLQSISVPVRSFPSVTNGDGFRELEWWRVSQDIQMGSGGYVTVELVNPTPLYASEHLYSSIQIYQQGQFAPPLCDVPGAPPPTPTPTPTTTGTPTPTPTPGVVSTAQTGTPVVTVTPSATNDPTRTPPFTPQPTTTPYPTSAGGTSTPLPTPTQYVPRERTPEPTPSPIFVQPMPTPNYPSISFPSVPGIASPAPLGVALTPNATTESQIQSVESWESDVNLVISSWQTQTNEALSWINPNITNTTGISTPAQIANVISNAVVRPIATIRALYLYMPNLWPFILMVLLMFGWIMFNLFAKYGLTIISEILEVVRRIIELIPGF